MNKTQQLDDSQLARVAGGRAVDPSDVGRSASLTTGTGGLIEVGPAEDHAA